MDAHATGRFFRPAHAEIDLGALARNYRTIVRLAKGASGVMAMVKADAYGHGAIPVSKKLVACGVTALGVATVEEGLELREAGIRVPILVMGGLMGMGAPASGVMISADLTPVVHSAGVVEPLEMVAQSLGKRVGIQLKIDTGMTRLGLRIEALPKLLEKLPGCRHVVLEGVMTHLAQAQNPEYTAYQLEEFARAKAMIENAVGAVPLWHIANSMAITKGIGSTLPGAERTWVRPGIILYGGMMSDHEIDPVMSLESRVMLIKSVPQGTKVSYDCTFTAPRKSRLGLIPVGYADGYPRALSNRAYVLVRGRRAPVVGRVTMDMIMIDITDVPEAEVGDAAVLMGSQGGERITSIDLADWAGTISYEIMTGVSARMPRTYKDSDL